MSNMDEDDSDDAIDLDYVRNHITEHGTPINLSDSENEEVHDESFNLALPTSHTYLGELEKKGTYEWFDDGETVNAISLRTSTWVFPGFTLPLVMYNEDESNKMIRYIEENKTFVLLCKTEMLEATGYGVTLEISQTSVKRGILSLIARGRQRCCIVPGTVRNTNLLDNLQPITVRILPEYNIPGPLGDSMLLALKRKRPFVMTDFDELKKCRYRRYHLAQFPFPDFVYQVNEFSYYIKQINDGLHKSFQKVAIPSDPYTLSFWFLQHFLLDHHERLALLKKKTVLERLRFEVECLKSKRTICCGNCNVELCDQDDVFIMSSDGIEGNFCNPGGHVHEVITVSKVRHFQITGSRSTQFSWFPGYAWIILQCTCYQHLGWKFIAVDRKFTLKPRQFYGLSRGSLKIRKN